jgi:hypothetical protein
MPELTFDPLGTGLLLFIAIAAVCMYRIEAYKIRLDNDLYEHSAE